MHALVMHRFDAQVATSIPLHGRNPKWFPRLTLRGPLTELRLDDSLNSELAGDGKRGERCAGAYLEVPA